MNILINAYAVSPTWGSEQGMAWNWISNLAAYCNLYIITEGQWRDEIEAVVENHPYKDHIHFYYNPVSERVREMCWNQGDWRFYWYYRIWQKKTLRMAVSICRDHHIEITHQLNMIGFREPGLLWKIPGIKHVWGPVGSMGSIPAQFLTGFSPKDKLKLTLKRWITHWQIRHGNVKKAINSSDAIIASLETTSDTIRKVYNKTIPVLGEVGLFPNGGYKHRFTEDGPLDILWVSRMIPTKMLNVALKAIARTNNPDNFRLSIVGTGAKTAIDSSQAVAKELKIYNLCKWYGKVSHDIVLNLMKEKDLFFFTSIFEGYPSVILESISNGLPILCVDTCGQGNIVDESIGWKIPLSDAETMADNFAKTLDYVVEHRELLSRCSDNCTKKQEQISWEAKTYYVLQVYENLLKNKSCLLSSK